MYAAFDAECVSQCLGPAGRELVSADPWKFMYQRLASSWFIHTRKRLCDQRYLPGTTHALAPDPDAHWQQAVVELAIHSRHGQLAAFPRFSVHL